jgi:hypothetical protein
MCVWIRFGLSSRAIRFITFVIVCAVVAAALPAAAVDGPRVVAIGEIQGAYESAVKTLQAAGLIDDQLHWSGGDAIVVQTGDLIDDGTRVKDVMDLFMRLQHEAEAAGGSVIVLLGNHEALNIVAMRIGVNYLTYETFADENSKDAQLEAYQDHVRWVKERAAALGQESPRIDEEYRSHWMTVHPPGYVEYVEAMEPDGVYGRWLRTLPASLQIGDEVFLHGGISPELEARNVEAINAKVADEIEMFDSYRAAMIEAGLITRMESGKDMERAVKGEIAFLNAQDPKHRDPERIRRAVELQNYQQWGAWYLVRHDGPMWFTGPSEWDEVDDGARMAELLDSIGVETLVVGHSQAKQPRIEARFNGRVLLTSSDMSDDPWVKTEPACLEIIDDQFTVISPTGRQVLIARK